jgi:hypothetical protein
MTVNDPALTLYKEIGFREAYQYWYRAKQSGGAFVVSSG